MEHQHHLNLDRKKLFQRLCSLYFEENPVDISLCCDPGEYIKAHSLILSSCSPFFDKVTLQTENQAADNFKVMLLDVKKPILLHILDLIYKGKVTVSENELADFYKTLDRLKMSNILKENTIVSTECKTENDEYHAKNKDAAITTPKNTLDEMLTEPQTNMNLKISDSPRKNNISTKKRKAEVSRAVPNSNGKKKAAEVLREIPNSNGDLVDLKSLKHDQLNEKHTKTSTDKRSRNTSLQPSTSNYSDSPVRKKPFVGSVHNKNVNDGNQESNTLNCSPPEMVVVVDCDDNRTPSPQEKYYEFVYAMRR